MHFLAAISTRYVSPTNTRGARISATAKRGGAQGTLRASVAYHSGETVEQNHHRAAMALRDKLNWNPAYPVTAGWLGEDSAVFVFGAPLPLDELADGLCPDCGDSTENGGLCAGCRSNADVRGA